MPHFPSLEKRGLEGLCALDGMCVSPQKSYMLKPNPQEDGIRRCGLWEGGALVNGISVLLK